MKVYLASRYGRREELVKFRDLLVKLGVECTSTWLDGEEDKTPEARERYARTDLADIDRSHMLIAFTESSATLRGGRHVEFGYALAKEKVCWIVGPRENLFMESKSIRQFDTHIECLAALHSNMVANQRLL